MAAEVIVEHFCVGVRVAGETVVDNFAKLFVCEYRSKGAVKYLTAGLGKALADWNITPHFQVFTLKRRVVCVACERCIG